MDATRGLLAQLKRGEETAEDVLRSICHDVGHRLQVTRSGIWVFNEIGDRITNIVEYDLPTGSFTAGETCDEDEYPAYFRAIKDEFRVVANDTAVHPATMPFEEGALAHRDVAALLDVLVTIGARPVAIVCAEQCGSTRQWTQDDIVYLERVGAMVRFVFRHLSMHVA